MKVPLSWIREFVDINASAEEIGTQDGGARPGARRPRAARATDIVMDFDVTANRPDCLSMAGIAREIAVVYDRPFTEPSERLRSAVEASTASSGVPAVPITIEAPDLCGRYVGAVADVTVAPSPAWMPERLTACGVRPISNIVDITNYVLLELGQPMHAFDHARLAGPAIVVRRARAGERITHPGQPGAHVSPTTCS